ncbi:MAG: type II CRISPR RNA-guided endonuclease Cas9 [Brevinemataceae bacterium]
MRDKYVLGLDLGTNSIGWACINHEKNEIVDAGVRIFDAAEDPKTKESLAKPRRTARLTRRRLFRRSVRLKKIIGLLKQYNFITQNRDVQSPYEGNIWELRLKGLDEKLIDQDLARILYHITKARGFKSSRKEILSEDVELQKANKDMQVLENDFQESGFRTIAEYLYNTYGMNHQNIRNKFGNYTHLIKQDLNEKELNLILDIQKEKGNSKINDSFRKELIDIFVYRKGLPSFESAVGTCELETNYRRAPKDAVSSSLFRAWNDLNNLKFKQNDDSSYELLSLEKRKELIEFAYEKANDGKIPTEVQIKNIIGVYSFIEDKATKEGKKDKKTTIYGMNLEMKKLVASLTFSSYTKLKNALCEIDENKWNQIKNDVHTMDSIIYVIAYLKEFKNLNYDHHFSGVMDPIIKELILNLKWDQETWENLFDRLSFDGTMGHSLQAMWHMQPYFEQEEILTYDKALEKVYQGKFNNRESSGTKFLPEFNEHDFTNPVVKRTLNQARLLINKLISVYGTPKQINIELARDLGKSKDERRKLEESMKQNQSKNEDYWNECQKLGIFDSIMYRLWKEQDEKCMYSNEIIAIGDLQNNYVEIDHILPLSRSGDDSLMNKVLVFASENQHKGNKTAFEYMQSKNKIEDYKVWVKNTKKIRYEKKERLLLENFNEEKAREYRSRHLNDTRYISKALANHIDKHIRPKDQKWGYVQTLAGRATTTLRKIWQMGNKDRQESHKHHALDALLIAGAGDMIKTFEQKITTASQYKNKGINPKDNIEHNIRRFGFDISQPWETFSTDARYYVENNVFVSRMGKRKVTGSVHKETIKSKRQDGNVFKTIKLHEIAEKDEKKITNIFNDMIDLERNRRVYDTILNHAKQFNWDMGKAFSNENAPLMPTNDKSKYDGSEKIIPKIRKIKVSDSASSNLILSNMSSERRKAAVDSGSLVRLDLFRNEKGKFETIPVYVFHYNGLPQVNDSYEFMFSIYKNDYLAFDSDIPFSNGCVEKEYNKNVTYFEAYWNTNVSSSRITMIEVDKQSKYHVTISKMKKITKYHVDILGKKHFIASTEFPEEKRLTLKEQQEKWKKNKN